MKHKSTGHHINVMLFIYIVSLLAIIISCASGCTSTKSCFDSKRHDKYRFKAMNDHIKHNKDVYQLLTYSAIGDGKYYIEGRRYRNTVRVIFACKPDTFDGCVLIPMDQAIPF